MDNFLKLCLTKWDAAKSLFNTAPGAVELFSLQIFIAFNTELRSKSELNLHLYLFAPPTLGVWIVNSALDVRISLLASILCNPEALQRVTFSLGEPVEGNLKASIHCRKQSEDRFHLQRYRGVVRSNTSLRGPTKIEK